MTAGDQESPLNAQITSVMRTILTPVILVNTIKTLYFKMDLVFESMVALVVVIATSLEAPGMMLMIINDDSIEPSSPIFYQAAY